MSKARVAFSLFALKLGPRVATLRLQVCTVWCLHQVLESSGLIQSSINDDV